MFSKLLYFKKRRCEVVLTSRVSKRIKKLPGSIQNALRIWSTLIEEHGVFAMRSVPGYHDESLRGERRGQRSSRLSRSYRVFYEELQSGEVIIISVLEVNKHEY